MTDEREDRYAESWARQAAAIHLSLIRAERRVERIEGKLNKLVSSLGPTAMRRYIELTREIDEETEGR